MSCVFGLYIFIRDNIGKVAHAHKHTLSIPVQQGIEQQQRLITLKI